MKVKQFFKETIWEDIIKHYYDKVESLYYNIKYGIMNLFIWFLPVWKNRDWDPYYIYRLLQFKIQLMEKLFKANDRYIGCKRDVHKMMICRVLLKRLADDDYLENATINHDKKWGDYANSNDKTDFSAMFRRENAITEENHKQQGEEFMRLGRHADRMAEQDLDLLFKILRRNIQLWWD